MKQPSSSTVPLGDLVTAAFDEAERCTADPRKVAILATRALARILARSRPVLRVGARRRERRERAPE